MTKRQILKVELLDNTGAVVDWTAHVVRGRATFPIHTGKGVTIVAVRVTRRGGYVEVVPLDASKALMRGDQFTLALVSSNLKGWNV